MAKTITTSIYRDFALRLRKFTMEKVYMIIIEEDITKQFKKYMRLLTEIKFDEDCYNAYYGHIKNIISSFIKYYALLLDNVIIDADRLANVADKNEILLIVDKTININIARQISFGKDYLPVQSAEERRQYDEMQDMYNDYLAKLNEFRRSVEKLDKQDKTDAFAKDCFKCSLSRTSQVFNFAHEYIAMFLVDRIKEIRISLEEILLRLKNNLRQIYEESEHAMNTLMHTLYDQNKDLMTASRQYRKSSTEIAEINRSIEKTREHMDVFKYDLPQARLEEEVDYWDKRVRDFREVAILLTKLKKDQDDLEKEKELYASRRCTELPGSKADCWMHIGENLEKRSKSIRAKIVEAGKALVTFFGIRGVDRLLYEDQVGEYCVDEFNHQVYVEDHGLGIYHMNCAGEFIQPPDTAKYCFDVVGRYIKNEKGEKIYQLANCTSEYRLDEDDYLKKVTKDCGHSEAINRKCRLRIKDPNDLEVFPAVEPVDLNGIMDPEVVKYLWDTFGHILPHALHDVCLHHTKNPIHHLAHKLLHYKHEKTHKDLEIKKKEAEQYRENIYKERRDKAAGASKAWKAKQVKRRKPEESDDQIERLLYDAHVSDQHFVESLNFYYQ